MLLRRLYPCQNGPVVAMLYAVENNLSTLCQQSFVVSCKVAQEVAVDKLSTAASTASHGRLGASNGKLLRNVLAAHRSVPACKLPTKNSVRSAWTPLI